MSTNPRVYTQVPIASIYASSNDDKHEVYNVIDGYLETYWRAEPTLSAGQHFIAVFPKKFDIASVDLSFLEGVKRIISFQIEALVENGTKWQVLKKAETKGSTNGLMRFNFATINTDRVKITTFTWQPKNDSKHQYLNAEVSEFRVFGYLEDKDLPINNPQRPTPNLPCPEGYSKDPQTGACIPIIESDFLKPKKVIGHSAIPLLKDDDEEKQDVKNVISSNTTDTWTGKGSGSYVIEDLGAEQKIYIVDIAVHQKPARAYNLNLKLYQDSDLTRPPLYNEDVSFDEADLELQVLLEDPIEARIAKLEYSSGNKDNLFVLARFHLLGESKNVVIEEPTNPPVEEPTEQEQHEHDDSWVTDDDKPITPKPEDPKPPVTTTPTPTPTPKPEVKPTPTPAPKPEEPTKPVDPVPVITVPPEPVIIEVGPTSKLDAQGVKMIYEPKKGGQVVIAIETNQKESNHDGQSRTSLYSNKLYSANSGELTECFVMNLKTDSEQNAPKLYSGGHTGSGVSDTTRQGCCYAAGINQNGTLHLAKEWPQHPVTPKAYDKIKYLNANWKNLGSIKDKFVGMKIIYFPITSANGTKKGTHIEWWFDKKGFATGKLENDWVQMAYADDFGDWGSKFGPAIVENSGIKYKGKVLGFYIRIDTPIRPVKFSHQGQHELALPAKKL